MVDMLNHEIDAKTFKALCSAGVIREVTICRVVKPSGDERWAIQVQYGRNTEWLRSKRQRQRLFNTIDTAANLVCSNGISLMRIDFG